jgi:molybdopterin converting factor small subunit
LIILINGTPHQKRETLIKNGDIVAIFPTLAGG